MRSVILSLAVACGISLMTFAQENGDLDAAPKLIALKNIWSRAAENKDLKVLDQILDEAFVSVDMNGRLMTKAEVLKDLNESGELKVVTESIVVRMHGEAAIVTGEYRMKQVRGGKVSMQRGRFVDTWRYRNRGWVAVASLATPVGE